VDLDHVALATLDARDALAMLVGELGGTILFGGHAVGFRPMQVRLGDATEGMTIELLEPWEVERNDFLARFLERHGAGPHHLTFKVADILAALDHVRAAGYEPVRVDLSDPGWKEAFLPPRQACGTVVQLAEYRGDYGTLADQLASARAHGASGSPRWWPEPPAPGPAAACLRRVVLRTPSLADSRRLYAGVLEGRTEAEGTGWVELAWPGGGHLRFEEYPDRPAGVDRLEGDALGPSAELLVAGARLELASRGEISRDGDAGGTATRPRHRATPRRG